MPEQAENYGVRFRDDFNHTYGPFRSLFAAVTFGLADGTADHPATVVAF